MIAMYARYRMGWLAIAGIAIVVAGCTQRAFTATAEPAQNAVDTNSTGGHALNTPVDVPKGREVATLAGGCFWCTEAIFTELKGVDKVQSGYAGGTVANPSYEQVCTGTTGHAETVQIIYDPKVITYRDLLHIFLTVHDPTTLNRQGADSGTQYRSAIFTHNDEQAKEAREVITEVQKAHIWANPIVTEVTPFTCFYSAEDYHKDYFARNPNQGYCRVVIAPKVAKFREKYAARLRR
jgi:peptide-methionine (S)-S-oxide reductase